MEFKVSEFSTAARNKYKQSGKTYAELELEINISSNQLSRIVRGGVSQSKYHNIPYVPDAITYARICRWLNLSLNTFFTSK